MFFDLIMKNNLKEFLKGFFGVKETPECSERFEGLFNRTEFSFQDLYSTYISVTGEIRKSQDLIDGCIDESFGGHEKLLGHIKQYKSPGNLYKVLKVIQKLNSLSYIEIMTYSMYLLTRQYKLLGQKFREFLVVNLTKTESDLVIENVDLEMLLKCVQNKFSFKNA